MSRELNLKVNLAAIDRMTRPISAIMKGSSGLAKTLRVAKDQLKGLNQQQRDVQAFNTLQKELAGNSQALDEARASVTAYQGALERQRTVQQGIAAEVKIHRAAVRNLHKAMISAKEPSAELNRQYALAKDHLQKLEATYGKSNSHLRQLKRELKDSSAAAAGLNAKHQALSARTADAASQLAKAGVNVERLADEEAGLVKSIDAANAAIDRQQKQLAAMAGVRNAMGPLRDAVGQVKQQLASLGQQALVAGAAGGFFFKTQLLDTASQFEKFESILRTLEGSSEKAQASMDWVSDFAARTPYDVAQVMDAFVKLRAYGLDPTNGLLKTLGDTSAAMGKDVIQSVEAIADAVTGENERLKEFGIKGSTAKGQITYEYTDKAGQQQTKTVDANNRKLIESTLTAIFNEKYAGAMDNMSKTWEGMVSNLGDQWTRFKLMIMKAGVFDWLKDRLGLILDTANRLAADGTLARYAKEIGQNLKAAGVAIWNFGERLYGVGKYLADMVGGWENLGMILLALKLVPVAAGLVAITQAMFGMGVALTGLLVANPVLAGIALAIAALAGLAFLVWKNWEPIKGWFASLWTGVRETFSQTMDWFASLPTRFYQFGADILTGLANGITSALGSVKTAITGAGDATVSWFKEKLGIHSPSRVFAELGGYTMQGLDQGIVAGQAGPLRTIAGMSKRMAAAGAVALGAGMALPAVAGSAIAIDSRPPLASPAGAVAGAQSFNFNLTINAAPGADANELAASVRREMERFMREQAARGRSALSDRE